MGRVKTASKHDAAGLLFGPTGIPGPARFAPGARGQHEHEAAIELRDSSATRNLQTLEHLPRRMEAAKQKIEQDAAHLRQQLADLETLSRATFAEQVVLDRALARQRELDALLGERAEDRRVDLASIEVADGEAEDSVERVEAA